MCVCFVDDNIYSLGAPVPGSCWGGRKSSLAQVQGIQRLWQFLFANNVHRNGQGTHFWLKLYKENLVGNSHFIPNKKTKISKEKAVYPFNKEPGVVTVI